MNDYFSDSYILVTGAASGIGRASAEHLHGLGARLILIDVDADALDDVLAAQAGVTRLIGDVSDESFWDRHAPQFSAITHALINAGVASAGPIEALSLDEWRRVMSVNLDGAFLTLRAVMRAMIARHADDGRGGAIVTTASVSGIKAEAGTAAYAASKAALIQLTRVAAKEGAMHSIRVNAVAPGGVDTPIWDSMPAFADMVSQGGGDRNAVIAAMASASVPLGSYAGTDEIAAQIAFLMGPGTAHMTGAIMIADGGYSL